MKRHDWGKSDWTDPMWEIVRFYCSLRGNKQKEFFNQLTADSGEAEDWSSLLAVDASILSNAKEYIEKRSVYLTQALGDLREEEDAIEYCEQNGFEFARTKTRSRDHHQSSKTLVATVTSVAQKVCEEHGLGLVPDPQTRCVWQHEGTLHVSARNLDGAIPSLQNPFVIWEIKEYWGKTSGGSKMSDAVYECQLVGKEIREYEGKSDASISHLVFLDGKNQWQSRKSDLARFIDLECQGLIDRLFVGVDVESKWEEYLTALLEMSTDSK